MKVWYECVQRQNDNRRKNHPTQNEPEYTEVGINIGCRTAVVIRITPTVMMMTPWQKEEQNI